MSTTMIFPEREHPLTIAERSARMIDRLRNGRDAHRDNLIGFVLRVAAEEGAAATVSPHLRPAFERALAGAGLRALGLPGDAVLTATRPSIAAR